MSFAAPQMLWALLLVPLALAAYVAARRSRRRYAVRFTAVPALKLASLAVPAWRRHLPAALALASLAFLGLALAKPQRTVAVAVNRASIEIVTDHSRSMLATDVAPDRLRAAKRAANTFLDQLPAGVSVGVVTFADGPDQVLTPSQDHDAAREAIDRQQADGATATGEALQVAVDALRHRTGAGRKPPAAIVLLSDGATTVGRDPVQVAGLAHIPIYTVSLGTGDATVPNPSGGPPLVVQTDPETLRQISQVSGGRAFTAQDSGQLSAIYRSLGSRLGQRKVRRETTAAFAIGGLVLLLGAAAGSALRSGRLP
ncbi:MAG: Ca-activated chloride channel [Thermoleophilaceae bacterium]|nr:Ca-activated chloride channel [Thermoleophilaceae bacterium]